MQDLFAGGPASRLSSSFGLSRVVEVNAVVKKIAFPKNRSQFGSADDLIGKARTATSTYTNGCLPLSWSRDLVTMR